MARNEQLIRQHKILQILERYRFGRTLEEVRDELVEELGLGSLHTRSVRRDLEALQAAGIHLESTTLERGRVWKLGPGAKGAHKITATATELISLSLSRDLLYPLAGTPFWQGIESFWHKMRETLPDSMWKHYEKYRQTLYVRGTPAKSYESQHGVLKTIHRCILEHRVLEAVYQPVGKDPRTRRLDPYAVVFYHSSLYIIAGAHEAPAEDRVRHLKLDRFQKAEALDEWFKRPPDFDLEKHLGESLGIFSGSGRKAKTFKIRISAYAAPWVLEDPWHADQQVEKKPDGSVILTIKAAHELEVIPRVLALGGEAELLSPKGCREEIARTIRKMATAYS